MDENTSWQKQLLVGVGLLVVVGLLVGGVIGVVALKAADVAGVGETQGPETGPPPGLGPTTPGQTTESTATNDAGTQPGTTTTSETSTRRPPQRQIVLTASPQQAATYQRVNLSGTYRAGEGTTLQVQREQGGTWADFPTSASVSGGTFATYIETGQTGPNRFRVIDTSSGRASNVVTVRIG